ncbi:hypothetical protein TcWFU_004125 [Taenia crassiceps]|uniref:Uncharacterized protein n=1 Tax=Taenia crassiceps TaxID=6207 RepID=A0ABR4QGW7_9CEST
MTNPKTPMTADRRGQRTSLQKHHTQLPVRPMRRYSSPTARNIESLEVSQICKTVGNIGIVTSTSKSNATTSAANPQPDDQRDVVKGTQ